MMRVCIFILILFVLCYDQTLYAKALSVEISQNSENVTGLLGENGTELECTYTWENTVHVHFVSFMALNRSTIFFKTIATFIPDEIPLLTNAGQYLKGRVTLTTVTRASRKAVITFNQLMCIDETLYKCHVSYLDSRGFHDLISKNISISVQVPPSKPDSVSIVHTPVDPLFTSAKHMEYRTPPPSSKVTSYEIETLSDLQIVKHYDTDDYDTTTSKRSNHEFSSDIRYRTTTYYVEHTIIAQGIAEGDNITIVCTGDVGKPPAKHVFEKFLNGQIVPIQDTVITTSISEMSENCSYYRTSNLTFKVTAKDNNAVIRCVVYSSMEESDMYVETVPIEVYYKEAQSTTFRNTVSPLSRVENTAVIVIGTVCGSIILVLVIVFGVRKNKCLLMRNRSDRSADYVNTTQQQDPSLYEEVGHALDVHNYEQLSRMEHLYNNANFSHN